MCSIVNAQMFSIWQQIPWLFNMSSQGRLRDETLKVLHGQTKEVIQKRRAEMNASATTISSEGGKYSYLNLHDLQSSSHPTNEHDGEHREHFLQNFTITYLIYAIKAMDEFGRKRRLAFLDSLLLAQKVDNTLTDQNIQEEVDTFMFEVRITLSFVFYSHLMFLIQGHDTTSSAIGFAIYLLSRNPDAQQLAYEEVVRTTDTESESMPYLEAVIKETLRLYPSVPFYSRKVTETLTIGEYKYIKYYTKLMKVDKQKFRKGW